MNWDLLRNHQKNFCAFAHISFWEKNWGVLLPRENLKSWTLILVCQKFHNKQWCLSHLICQVYNIYTGNPGLGTHRWTPLNKDRHVSISHSASGFQCLWIWTNTMNSERVNLEHIFWTSRLQTITYSWTESCNMLSLWDCRMQENAACYLAAKYEWSDCKLSHFCGKSG